MLRSQWIVPSIVTTSVVGASVVATLSVNSHWIAPVIVVFVIAGCIVGGVLERLRYQMDYKRKYSREEREIFDQRLKDALATITPATPGWTPREIVSQGCDMLSTPRCENNPRAEYRPTVPSPKR